MAQRPDSPTSVLRHCCFGLDSLSIQVIKLGVLRKLGSRIPSLLAVLCHDGLARYGTVANTLIEANERVLSLGRLCKACKVPPG